MMRLTRFDPAGTVDLTFIQIKGSTMSTTEEVLTSSPATQGRVRVQCYINGTWTEGSGNEIVSTNPATGDVVARLKAASEAEVDQAVAAARAAQPAWERLSVARRAEMLHRAAENLHARKEEAARLVSREMGKTIPQAREDVDAAVEGLNLFAEDALRHFGQIVPATWDPDANKRILVTHVAVGVVATLTPWNFPIAIPCELVAPALAAGNAVVWKPSEAAPASGNLFAEVLIEAGFPPGVFNVVHGEGSVGSQLVAHPGTDMIGFVGSTAVGERISRNAGVKKLLLELGGNGPIVVMDDADLDAAVEATVTGAYYCSGQVCTAAGRVLVHDAVYDEFVERLATRTKAVRMGDPADETVTMGPLAIDKCVDLTVRHVEDAIAKGARVMSGGNRDGMFYEPTVLVDVTSDMEIAQEETFGPVAPIIRFADAADAIRLANETKYGLTGAVFTRSLETGWKIAEQMQCGTVHVNETTNYWELMGPFGGMKQSGVGRVLGGVFASFTNPKQITFDFGPSDSSLVPIGPSDRRSASSAS